MRCGNNKGFTLLEAVIALACWLVLATGVLFMWQYTAASSSGFVRRYDGLENARIAMDGLITNIQLAKEIDLLTIHDDILRRMTLIQLNPLGNPHPYEFSFNPIVAEGSPSQHRLLFGNVEFARGIRRVYIVHTENSHLDITVETSCDPPLVLHGSVDIRYKIVTVR